MIYLSHIVIFNMMDLGLKLSFSNQNLKTYKHFTVLQFWSIANRKTRFFVVLSPFTADPYDGTSLFNLFHSSLHLPLFSV